MEKYIFVNVLYHYWYGIKAEFDTLCFVLFGECFFYKSLIMNITDYRLTSMEEPSDEMLHELMEQVAASARQSSAHAEHVLQEKMRATINTIKNNRQLSVLIK